MALAQTGASDLRQKSDSRLDLVESRVVTCIASKNTDLIRSPGLHAMNRTYVKLPFTSSPKCSETRRHNAFVGARLIF